MRIHRPDRLHTHLGSVPPSAPSAARCRWVLRRLPPVGAASTCRRARPHHHLGPGQGAVEPCARSCVRMGRLFTPTRRVLWSLARRLLKYGRSRAGHGAVGQPSTKHLSFRPEFRPMKPYKRPQGGDFGR
jgi:hypothetical protein